MIWDQRQFKSFGTTRYVHLNPLRAKVVKDLNELGSYAYGGHSALLGRVNVHGRKQRGVLEIVLERRAGATVSL